MSGVIGDRPLVGRDAQIAVIDAVLGRRPVIGLVLSGAAGTGKTRLVHECAARAAVTGRPPLLVVPSPATAGIALGALADLVVGGESRPERIVDLVARVRRAVVARAEGGTGPPVLLVDDAHLLDDVSAAVLLQLAAAGEATVVVAVRSGEPVPDAVQALWKDGLAERVDVGPLSPAEVHELAELVLGGPLSGASSRELWRVSLGNPLFVCELVLGATEGGYLVERDGVWRFVSRLSGTPRLTELIAARLGQASGDERWALDLLAVAGDLELGLLDRLVPPDVLERLEWRGLLTIVRAGTRRLARLAHPLYGDTLRREMGELKAMAANRALADAVEAAGPQPEDVIRAAVWRLDGGGDPPPDLMLEAARLAHFGHDEELAARLAGVAAAAGAGVAATLVEAQALRQLGRNVEVVELLEKGMAEADTDEHRGLLASELAVTLRWSLGRPAEAVAVLEQAGAELTDPNWRNELVAVQATFDLLGGSPLRAIERAAPLLDAESGRPFVVAAVAAGPALAVVGRISEALAVADRGLAARLALGPQDALDDAAIHVVTRALALAEAGLLADAAELCNSGYEGAITTGSATGQAWFALLAGRVALVTGQLATARRLFAESASLYDDLDQPGNRRWALAGVVLAAAMAGDQARAATARDTLDAVPTVGLLLMEPDVERARAWAVLAAGDAAGARAQLEQAVAVAQDSGAAALEAAAWHDAARMSGVAGAAVAAARLEELAAGVEGNLAAARSAHVSALAVGDAAALEGAAQRLKAMGALLFAAEAEAAAAGAHRRAGRGREAQRASARSRALVASCEDARTPALLEGGAAVTLTAREREIARLAVTGLANREIAASLDVSTRTVENHLQRAYEKLGVRSRAELVDALDPAEPSTNVR
jgi:DNA-binding NarL/FixJ family response regulator/type II secretory pathway predicted ATPase ExeA